MNKCHKCGKVPAYVLVDGYDFGDRLLEGVAFKVKDVKGKPKCIGVTEESKTYFELVNKKKWMLECESYCKQLDIAQCPKCITGEVPVWGNEDAKKRPVKIVKLNSISDLLK